MSLTLKQLQDYSQWIGKNPETIRTAVKKAGGWRKVFPASVELPVWASRVRNYLNVVPVQLKLLNEKAAEIAHKSAGVSSGMVFQSDVYEDKTGRHWFLMTQMGSAYHWKSSKWDNPYFKGAAGALSSARTMPVFKLVAFDGTGGSHEICVRNPQNKVEKGIFWDSKHGDPTIGPAGKFVAIRGRLVTADAYQGTYNYADTAKTSSGEHTALDVTPHRKSAGFYLKAPLDMSGRAFPTNDAAGNPLAAQGWKDFPA